MHCRGRQSKLYVKTLQLKLSTCTPIHLHSFADSPPAKRSPLRYTFTEPVVFVLMDSIDLSGLPIVDPILLESEQGSIRDASPLSPKLRDKLNKLAKWRIDPCLIDFLEGTSVFEGGHATVSRALLTPASTAEVDLNDPENVEGMPAAPGGPPKKQVVAVKKLKTENGTENGNSPERVLELALREAGLLVGLSHGHIIKLKGFVEDLPYGRIWLVFPWEEHGNLKDFVASQDWEIPERISLISDVTFGVQYLHSQHPPILHGDLKSVNIVVNSSFRAVITDFGSARRLEKEDVDPQMKRTERKEVKSTPDFQATFCATSSTMTFTGNEYTLRWAAPELLMDDEPSLSSDIWALGWIAYEVMTNSLPFENVRKDSMVIKHVVDGKLPSVTDHVRVSLILQLSALMVKCWSLDPTQRPTAEDCRKSLHWMPIVVPVLQRGSDQVIPRTRSPELLMKLATMYRSQDDCFYASKLYTEALDIYTETTNKAGMASALYGLGWTHLAQCEYSKAAASYSKALELSTDIGDKRGRSDALWGLAAVHSSQEEYSEAIALYSEAIQISIELDDRKRRADILTSLSEVHRFQGDYSQAVTCAFEALEIYTSMGGLSGRATALWYLAEAYRCQKDYTQAITLFSDSLKICTDIGDRFGTANALLCLSFIHSDQGQHEDALSLYKQSGAIFEQIGNPNKVAETSSWAARARKQLDVERVE